MLMYIVLKIIKLYMNCAIIAVASYGHNIEHNGLLYEHCSKAYNRLGLNLHAWSSYICIATSM